MTAREADEVLVSADASKTGRVFITVVHGRYETALNVSAGELVRLRAAIDAHLSTPPADDVRETARTFAGGVGWAWESLAPMWQERFEQAARTVLARPRGTVTPAPEEVDAAAQSLSSLSDEEWAVARGEAHVQYYVVSARLALEAAYGAREQCLARRDAEDRDALTPRPPGPCPERYPDPADDVQCWLTAGHEGEHIVDGGTYRWSTPPATVLPAPGIEIRPYGTVTDAVSDELLLESRTIRHARYGGLGGDVASLTITAEAWRRLGEPRAVQVSASAAVGADS